MHDDEMKFVIAKPRETVSWSFICGIFRQVGGARRRATREIAQMPVRFVVRESLRHPVDVLLDLMFGISKNGKKTKRR